MFYIMSRAQRKNAKNHIYAKVNEIRDISTIYFNSNYDLLLYSGNRQFLGMLSFDFYEPSDESTRNHPYEYTGKEKNGLVVIYLCTAEGKQIIREEQV